MVISISIPEGAKCLLKENQQVEFGAVFLEYKTEKVVRINVSHELGINPSKIFKYLKKFVGESIKKKEIIAIKKGLFSTRKLTSSFEGTIQEVDHNSGEISLIIRDGEEKVKKAFFIGKVKKIEDNELKLEVDKFDEYLLKPTDKDFGGEALYYEKGKTPIDATVKEKTIVSESINSFSQIKSEALGASGFVLIVKPPDKTDIPFVLIKNIDDFKKIIKKKYRYCLVNSKSSKIIFYD